MTDGWWKVLVALRGEKVMLNKWKTYKILRNMLDISHKIEEFSELFRKAQFRERFRHLHAKKTLFLHF